MLLVLSAFTTFTRCWPPPAPHLPAAIPQAARVCLDWIHFDWPSSIPFSSSPFPERFVDRKLVFSSSSCRPFPLPRRRRRGKPGVSRRSPRTLTRQSAGQSAKALRRELQAHGTRENGWTSSQGAQPWPSPPLSTMSATALQRLHCSASAGRSASSSSCPAARSLCLSAPTFMYVLKVLLKG